MKAYPLNKNYTDAGRAPCLEYNFTITNPGQYTVTAYISPANNPVKNRGLYLAIGVDGKAPLIINTLPENYAAGDPADKNWCRYVLENGRRCSMSIELEKGQHTLQYIQIESGVVLQKIEIAKVPSRSFFGYLPTYQKR
jgi:hypothetical protein